MRTTLKQLRLHHERHQEVDDEALGAAAGDNSVIKRMLQQHETDETRLTEGSGDSISDTETWVDGASLRDVVFAASPRHHSRGARTGRRARNRARQWNKLP